VEGVAQRVQRVQVGKYIVLRLVLDPSDGTHIAVEMRGVSDAGIALVATLAGRLGIEALASRFVRLRRDRPGAAHAGRNVMALLFAMVLGADSIDDAGVLRTGRTRRLLGGLLPAPSTLGTFLGRSPSATCASSTRCWVARSSVPGRPAPAPATVAW
jgi:hypothetical protein